MLMTEPGMFRDTQIEPAAEWRDAVPRPKSMRSLPFRHLIWPLLVVLGLAAAAWQYWAIDANSQKAAWPVASGNKITIAALSPQARLAVTNPLAEIDLPADKARLINAEAPFVPEGLGRALPFLFAGQTEDRERATSCLATAAYYEAGDDRPGQEAVVQVVLNRVRHPLFPKSVCGVVFQGSERRTGCQFSFACDGSMSRRQPGEAAWARARLVATEALGGSVYEPVGLATHFHTDWVVPYWSGAMDKIAQVGTHLFFRWRGRVGSSAAFSSAPNAGEPVGLPSVGLLGAIPSDQPSTAPALIAAAPAAAPAGPVEQKAQVDDKHLLRLDASAPPQSYAFSALQLCHGLTKCQVFGYVDNLPTAVGNWASTAQADFYYDGGSAGSNMGYWNCRRFSRMAKSECLPGTAPTNAADAGQGDKLGG